MKISLLTPTPPDISAFGTRAISAYLKAKGHRVVSIFLPGGIELLQHGKNVKYEYPDVVIEQLREIVSGSDLIGISFLSQYRDRAIQLSTCLKASSDAPVIWGGIHAEIRSEEALEYADGACLTEGESVMAMAVERIEAGKDLDGIPGLVIRKNGHATDPGIPSLIQDLDTLPFADFGTTDHWILDPIASRVEALNPDRLSRILPLMPLPGGDPISVFRTMTSRGCPHRCTYCANQIRADRHPGERYLRYRSPRHVLNEIHEVLERYSFIKGIHFIDDVFTAMPEDDLRELCEGIQHEFDMPYYAQISPSTLSEFQLDLLINTGLVFLEMGIQTGSRHALRMYNRSEDLEQTLEAAKLIFAKREKLLTPHYHVILDNPWESRDDVRQTLNFLTRIPGKYMLCLASLTFYPGTRLYEKAMSEGRITDEEREIYQKPFYIPKGRYLNYLVYVSDISWIPRGLLRFLGGWPAEILDRPVFNGVFDLARRITDKLRLLAKGASALSRGEFHRIFKYFRRIR